MSGLVGDRWKVRARGCVRTRLLVAVCLAVVAGSDYYIADTGHHRVCKVSGGTATNYVGTGTAGTTGDGGAPGSATCDTPKSASRSCMKCTARCATCARGR